MLFAKIVLIFYNLGVFYLFVLSNCPSRINIAMLDGNDCVTITFSYLFEYLMIFLLLLKSGILDNTLQ